MGTRWGDFLCVSSRAGRVSRIVGFLTRVRVGLRVRVSRVVGFLTRVRVGLRVRVSRVLVS